MVDPFKRLRDLGLSKKVAHDVVHGLLSEEEGLRIKAYKDGEVSRHRAQLAEVRGIKLDPKPDPNSKRSRKKEKQNRYFDLGRHIFDLCDADFPDDPVSRTTWLWIVEKAGAEIAQRAVEKAAALEDLVTSDEVMAAARTILRSWVDQGLLAKSRPR